MNLIRSPFFLVLAGLQFCVLGVILSTGLAQAAEIGPSAPYGPNSNPTKATYPPTHPDGAHVFFIRNNPDIGRQRDLRIKAYYPSTITASQWDNAFLEFNPGGALGTKEVCDLGASGPDYGGDTDYDQNFFVVILEVQNKNGSIGAKQTYTIRRDRICIDRNALNTGAGSNPDLTSASGLNNANNTLFSQYSLPGSKPTASTAVNEVLDSYVVNVTVQFNPDIGQNFNGGAARLRVDAKGNTAAINDTVRIGQRGGGGAGVADSDSDDDRFSFPVIGDWSINDLPSGYTKLRVPLGYCEESEASLTRWVGIFDADRADYGRFEDNFIRFRVKELSTGTFKTFSDADVTGGSVSSGDSTTVEPDVGAQKKLGIRVTLERFKKYELIVYDLHPRNTIDLRLPFDSIYGDPDSCKNPPPPSGKRVGIASNVDVRGGGAETEAGSSLVFDQYASLISDNVYSYPTGVGSWGFDEIASRQAVNNGTTPNAVNYGNSQSAMDSAATGAAASTRQCLNGTYNPTCPTYRCADGSAANGSNVCISSTGGYQWRCTWNSGPNGVITKNYTGTNMNCDIYRHRCNENGNLRREYWKYSSASDVCFKYNCPSPSVVATSYNPADANMNCRIAQCDGGAQTFGMQAGQSPSDVAGSCAPRCYGARHSKEEPLRKDQGDMRCYKPPAFNVRCQWSSVFPPTPPTSGPWDPLTTNDNKVTGYATNNYCAGDGNSTRTLNNVTAGRKCAAGRPLLPDGANTWVTSNDYLPPGKGSGPDGSPDFSSFRTTWTIDVFVGSECEDVGFKPFFHVLGGDVNATGTFQVSNPSNPSDPLIGSCPTPVSLLKSYNKGRSAGAPLFVGSGTQLAAFAPGAISGFVSSSRQAGAADSPKLLTFANTLPSFWGGLSNMETCIENKLFAPAELPSAPTVLDISTQPNINETKYVNGDVYIKTQIDYSTSFSLSSVPSYTVIATGNIYIASNVSLLNGNFISRKNIYTCAIADGTILKAPSGTDMKNSCNNQLRINGALVAAAVKMLRIGGVTTSSPANIDSTNGAELIMYSPEIWLKELVPSDNYGPDDSRLNLPPVL